MVRKDDKSKSAGTATTVKGTVKSTVKKIRSRVTRKTESAPLMDRRSDADSVRAQIELAAYFRAEARGFAPGHELEDWLWAEQEVAGRD
jgi:hypothetical protein